RASFVPRCSVLFTQPELPAPMKVPLFPLNLVLFPGQSLPLHIFEERYKTMLKKCLDEQIPFGIALIRDSGRAFRGSPHNTGTLARVMPVAALHQGRCVAPAPHHGSRYPLPRRGDAPLRLTSPDPPAPGVLPAERPPPPAGAA